MEAMVEIVEVEVEDMAEALMGVGMVEVGVDILLKAVMVIIPIKLEVVVEDMEMVGLFEQLMQMEKMVDLVLEGVQPYIP